MNLRCGEIQEHSITTIRMSYYKYLMPLKNHALNFYSALISSAALIVEAFILLRPEKPVKEDNVINAIIVNEDSLIVQII